MKVVSMHLRDSSSNNWSNKDHFHKNSFSHMSFNKYHLLSMIILLFNMSLVGQTKYPNLLYTIVDTTQNPLTTTASNHFRQLQNNRSTEWAQIIQFNNLGSLLTHDTLDANLILAPSFGQVVKNIFVKNYAVYSTNSNDYFWSGYNSDGTHIQLTKDSLGYGGNVSFFENNEKQCYSFIALSNTETAIVKFDSIFISADCVQNPDSTEDVTGDNIIGYESNSRAECPTRTIRILFLYTLQASYQGLRPANIAYRTVTELNLALVQSGISPDVMTTEVAGVAYLPNFTESSDIEDDTKDLVKNNDAKDLRDDYYADIVVLLTGDTYDGAFGNARFISALKNNAFALVEIVHATTFLTATHEISHIIGGRHHRPSLCDNGDIWTSHHGVRVGNNLSQTIMATCGSFTNIGIFSSDNFPADNPVGNNNNRNTHKFIARADLVPCFRDEPPSTFPRTLPVGIWGPLHICRNYINSSVFWRSSLSPLYLTTPVSMVWEVSSNGISNWIPVSTDSMVTLPQIVAEFPTVLSSSFCLRLKITDGNLTTGSMSQWVSVFNCPGINEITERSSSETTEINIYPNPTSDFVQISGITLESVKEIHLFDETGRELSFEFSAIAEQIGLINLRFIIPGIYTLVITDMTMKQYTYQVVKI